MSTLHRINMLRIKACSDAALWYSNLIGQLVPHLGWTAADGFRSREPDGLVNFVRTQDAEPTHVHIGHDLLGHWPFNCSQAPTRKVVQITRRAATAESAASLLRSCATSCDRLGLRQGLGDCQATPLPTAPTKATTGQSRAHSLAETLTSVAVGFVVSFGITAVVLPAYGHQVTHAENLGMTAIFTVASVLRSYALRRTFNWLHTKGHA